MASTLNKICTGLVVAWTVFSSAAQADWVHARCDIYPRGEDHTSVVIPCVFSQRQGFITIDRTDGVTHDLVPRGDRPGNYRDQEGHDVYRQSGLGKLGLIFRFPTESVFIYWDTAGLPGTADGDNYTAPYSTAKFDATARISCTLTGQGKTDKGDCAIGINRGSKQRQAVIAIMRPDGVERVLQFDGEQVVSPGEGKVQAWLQSDEWEISIDDRETYRIPLTAIEGG